MAGTQAIESNTHTVKRGVIFHVDPELLTYDVDEEHPLYESDRARVTKHDEDLILSIIALGVSEPVLVNVEQDAKGKKTYVVVDGRRRVFNAIEANKRLKKLNEAPHLVPVVAAKGDENKLSELMVAANEIRKEHSVMVKAAKASRMLERVKSADRVARAFGVTTTTIAMWGKLATLCNSVRKMVDEGKIAPSAAAKFAGMSPADQVKAVEEFLNTAEAQGVKPTARLADTTTRNKREGREQSTAPSTKQLRAIIEREELRDRLDPVVVKTIKWMLGEGSPVAVGGLQAALNVLTNEAKAKAEKKAERAEKKAQKTAQAS